MPSKPIDTVLRDILHHIELAANFSAGFDRASFKHDTKTVYAVTRCLEIISEASRRLPEDLKARHPAIGWKQMAGAGNVYRHDYEDVAAEFVWETVVHCRPCGPLSRSNSSAGTNVSELGQRGGGGGSPSSPRARGRLAATT
jgi:uncharacterized protein with HEPN domain